MKVLISTAIWGKTYVSIFLRYSLATLLSRRNIPELAGRASITFHIVTTKTDRRLLIYDPAFAELRRFCTVEWEAIEDFGIVKPPEGPGGEKYPFLSALQNIAIARSIDHDAIVFNFADFVWADGSLTHAVDMLLGGREPLDAVFAFCLPVDRDSAVTALEKHRRVADAAAIELTPRAGAKIAIECMHREAKVRFWDHPRFTVTPSYLIWRANEAGVVIRAYHQSILALRVRPSDPGYLRGIVRGGLDSSFAGQLALSALLGFATDADKILVFSLYDTPVDSRLPAGVTREMSLKNLLAGDVTPAQRRFAESPICLRLHEGDDALWRKVIEDSWRVLRQTQDTTCFDQSLYDRNLQTHGVVPTIARLNVSSRDVLPFFKVPIKKVGGALTSMSAGSRRVITRTREIFHVLVRPPLLRAAIGRRLDRIPAGRTARRMGTALLKRQRAAVERILAKVLPRVLVRHLGLYRGFAIAPGIWIEEASGARLGQAIAAEDATGKGRHDTSMLRSAEDLLRQTIKSTPIWTAPVQALGRNLWFQGRFDEALQTFAAAEQLRDVGAWVAGWPVDSCVFLPRNCAQSIGLMGHLDAFVKYKILTEDPRPYYLIAPPQDVVNAAFLDYWRERITIVSQTEEIDRLARLEPVYGVNWNWVMPDSGTIVFVHKGIAAVQRAWERAGRAPLLQLREHHADALRAACVKWGMKEQDRFVCLHVRAFGFYPDAHDKAQEFRNTPIESYYPLIRDLTDSGRWVIRMGDASMPPLDLGQCGASGRVVDYAISAAKSAELDVALCARCELFVSSPSGLHTVAHAFGRPVCEVNYPIYSGFPWHIGDIFIPQLYFSQSENRILPLQEVLGSDSIHRDHQFLLDPAGISLIPNEPDDMVETVREALSPMTYRVENSALADQVCAAFDELNRAHKLGISGKLGRYFAMKYAAQLLPANQ